MPKRRRYAEHEYVPGVMKAATKEKHDLVVQLWQQGHSFVDIATTVGLRNPEYAREIVVMRGLIPEPVESDHIRRLRAWEKAREGARKTLGQLLKTAE